MSTLMSCGVCCMLTSIWGVIQLICMGLLYWMEAVTLLEDVEPEEYDDYDDFIAKTKQNYSKVAINCWITSGMYLVSLGLSLTCIRKANKQAILDAKKLENDDLACTPQEPKKKKAKKVK